MDESDGMRRPASAFPAWVARWRKRLNFDRRRFLHGVLHGARHPLPAALMLACAVTTLGVFASDVVQGTDSLVMRAVFSYDALRGSSFVDAAHENHESQKTPQVTLITLTPEANAVFLNGISPVPRARLACLILALADQLDALAEEPAQQGRTPPVIGIDIDITPPESPAVSPTWAGLPDDADCRAEIAARTKLKSPTTEQAMTYAIERLATGRCVVSIAFPRYRPQAIKDRNDYIRRMAEQTTPGTKSLPASCRQVSFASSDIAQVPHELVTEYATTVVPADRSTLSTAQRRGDGDPSEVCTLGRALGARLAELHRRRPTP